MGNKANKAAKVETAAAASNGGPNAGAILPLLENSGPAHKYRDGAANVPVAGVLFRLGAGDGALFAATGRNKAGRATILALVCYAAAKAGATTDKGADGLAIVRLMQSDADIVAAYANSRAGKYAPRGTVPCPRWCADYVSGAARGASPLLVRAAS